MIKELVKVLPELREQPSLVTVQHLGKPDAETQVSFPFIVIAGKLCKLTLHPGLREVICISFIPVREHAVKKPLI